jgi:N-acetylmuramoyl-L-alanine amidase
VLAGLKVHRVVIDAGHGGNDTGAIGPTGVKEKDVTLAIARKLASKLEDAGLEVVLTRDTDRYVKLADRTALANEKRGDLFISVHCNAGASRKWRGVETYTLNLNSDRYAARLAARENAGSERGIGELQYILADLATKANTDDSTRLAHAVQSELHDAVREDGGKEARDLGVKQALFFVLVGARMPAILVETSFISNPEEEKLLKTASYQDDVAGSIADGVDRFIADREKLARGDGPAQGSGVF